MADLTADDIRAAVAAGVLSEAQATRLIAIAGARRGFRLNMGDDDEPFELFKGFSEIFVTVGLILLTGGFIALSLVLTNLIAVPIITLVLSVVFARYFTLKRRMTLPSIYLAASFAFSAMWLVSRLLIAPQPVSQLDSLIAFAATGALLIGYFAVFRVPFTLFLVGLCGIGVAFSLAGVLFPDSLSGVSVFARGGWKSLTDLGTNPVASMTLLLFGIVAFAFAMRFDLRDPHRISRNAANAFWLHILAAPAIVNVVTASLLNIGGTAGYVLAALALVVITAVALIIDRRSFLTAGIIYIGIILAWAMSAANVDAGWGFVWTLLLMGAFITATGTWWTQLRARIMAMLPDSALKSKLPPYSEVP